MKIKALAHRGYPIKYPENTLISYQAAYDLGFTHLELDVHLSKDGIPVLMHDVTIDRTTNGKGMIKDYTLEELRQFKVGGSETIPTFEEGLLLVKDKMHVSVELKQQGNLYTGLEEAVLATIKKVDMMNQVYVNSFDHYAVKKMRTLSKEIELGVIQPGATPAVIAFMKEINAKYLSIKVEFLTDEYVDLCNKSGIQIVVWPVDHKWQFKKVSRYPNVLSTTNKLEHFKKMYQESLGERI